MEARKVKMGQTVQTVQTVQRMVRRAEDVFSEYSLCGDHVGRR